MHAAQLTAPATDDLQTLCRICRTAPFRYGFKADDFHATGFASCKEYTWRCGPFLYMIDMEEYGRI